MLIIKKILSFLGIVLGSVGLLLCLAVIVGAWWVNPPLTDGLLQVFPPIEMALSSGDAVVEAFTGFVADAQTQFTQVADAKPIASALEDEIQQVAVYVDIAGTVTDSVDQVATGLMESDRFGRTDTAISKSAGRLSETLSSVTETLDSVETLSQQVKDGRNDKIDTLNGQLDTLQSRLTEIETVINQTENEVADIKGKVPRWINIGSLIVTLLFIWFGVAQYFLLRSCW